MRHIMTTMEELRRGIDAFDLVIIELLKQRAACFAQLPEEEQSHHQRLFALNASDAHGLVLPEQSIVYIFRQIELCELTEKGKETVSCEGKSRADLDAELLSQIRQRASLVHHVGVLKSAQGKPIFAPEREYFMYRKIEKLNADLLEIQPLTAVYREIISCSFLLEGGLTIAYLGPDGSWSHQAALSRFGHSTSRLSCNNFAEVFAAVESGKADYGIIPVENSSEGSVSQVIDLLAENTLDICAHSAIAVQNCLLGNGAMEDIRTIYSHAQVFGQCRRWLQTHFPQVSCVNMTSTTAAAHQAYLDSDQGAAALGSAMTAEVTHLSILQHNVQDSPSNKTRFVVVGKQRSEPTGQDRTTLCFAAVHEAGSLVTALTFFKNHNINLYNIHSRPMGTRAWEYLFFVDVEGHRDEEPLRQCLVELEEHCPMLKVLGSYPEH